MILATLCCVTPTAAEVRRSNGRIVMEEADYRFFITRIKTLEAETAALTKAIAEERSSFDVYVSSVQAERTLHAEQVALHEQRIEQLSWRIRRLNRQKVLPGLLVGGGMSTHGDLEGFVGIGWKIW